MNGKSVPQKTPEIIFIDPPFFCVFQAAWVLLSALAARFSSNFLVALLDVMSMQRCLESKVSCHNVGLMTSRVPLRPAPVVRGLVIWHPSFQEGSHCVSVPLLAAPAGSMDGSETILPRAKGPRWKLSNLGVIDS